MCLRTVPTLMSRASAICALVQPFDTSANTWRSRSVSRSPFVDLLASSLGSQGRSASLNRAAFVRAAAMCGRRPSMRRRSCSSKLTRSRSIEIATSIAEDGSVATSVI